MNTPNPLVPQGTLEKQSKGTSTVRIAIFTIISIHAVFFAGLLMQGCRRDETPKTTEMAQPPAEQNPLPPIPTNQYVPSTQEAPLVAENVPPPNTYSPPPVTDTWVPPASAPLTTGETKDYTVVRGDTLSRISKANSVTLGALRKANPNVDPAKLKVGQKIQIPVGAASVSPVLGFKEPDKSDSGSAGVSRNVHVVKAGETLTRIAKQHGTSVNAIKAANNMKSTRLLVGQKLKLPAPSGSSTSAESGRSSSVPKLSATNPANMKPSAMAGTSTNLQ